MNPRRVLLEWAEQGRIAAADLPRACALAGVLPARDDWRRFLDRLLLWMGTVLVAAGVIFFLAYNWQDLHRFAKLALAETLLVLCLGLVWRLGLEGPAGRAALLAACLLLGALLALIGQTYQTGADTFELFGAWAALILPWVLVGRWAPLWLLWLGLVNLAVALWFGTFPGVFGWLSSPGRMAWLLLAFNTVALAVWETVAARGVAWLHGRWGPRLLATVGGVLVTGLAMMHVLGDRDADAWAVPAWLAWLGGAWVVYRRVVRDLFVLAGGVLSVIVVVATFFGRHLAHRDAGGFLLVGLIVIALSGAGGWWLKRLAAEEAS